MKLKDKKIEILRVITEKDADGFAVEHYEPIHSGKLWAYFRHLSGQEMQASGATFGQEQVLFVINWRGDVTTTGTPSGCFARRAARATTGTGSIRRNKSC